MAITDLLPWKKEEQKSLAERRTEQDPFLALQDEMNRMFDSFFEDPRRSTSRLAAFMPHMDVSENDKEVTVTAEIPGMDENDIQVTYHKGTLVISGEKRDDHQEKSSRYHRIERTYGSFRREVAMPCEVEEDKITATFKKGVITVVLPKSTRPEVLGKRIVVSKS
jgi:HSP20 family protein